MIIDYSKNGEHYITEDDFIKALTQMKEQQLKDDEFDTLGAYIALGGNPDKSGSIDAIKLIDILKN